MTFKWYSGFATVQKQKSFHELHKAFLEEFPTYKVLEVSSVSNIDWAQKVSAFNLKVKTSKGTYSVEQVFQAGKVFEEAGSQEKILHLSPKLAQAITRKLVKNDNLKGFMIFGEIFPLEPKTLFYNWIYLHALHQNELLANKVAEYAAFTDIYFNPEKQINCQAEACAIYVSLTRRKLLDEALSNIDNFKRIIYGIPTNDYEQIDLFK
ncbi:hypothetical protein FC54_GL000778 [Ligilactobacillus saerimneri DSM 16049]|nr:hypothetical protein FC54_GL000778 [Ligilactobacillus saerimneri DSM 16049]